MEKKQAEMYKAETTWFQVFVSMIENGDVAKMGQYAVTVYLLARNFINADMGNATEDTVFHTITDHALDRRGNSTPCTTEKFGDGIPKQHLGSFGQKATTGTSKALFPCHPGKFLRANSAAFGTVRPPRLVRKPHLNIPQRQMTEKTDITAVAVDGRMPAGPHRIRCRVSGRISATRPSGSLVTVCT